MATSSRCVRCGKPPDKTLLELTAVLTQQVDALCTECLDIAAGRQAKPKPVWHESGREPGEEG